MTDDEMIKLYVSLVPFLSEVCGPGTEIVVHDASCPEHSLIAIGNNISGRQIGNPLTDLAQEITGNNVYEKDDYLANYAGYSKGRHFLSSTYFIKNEGRLIGLLCINKDMTAVDEAGASIRSLLEKFNLVAPSNSEISEKLDDPVTDIMRTRIADTISQTGVSPARMSRTEKIQVVHQLNDNGVMLLRGAVAEIAKQLRVSVPSVYRYLNTPCPLSPAEGQTVSNS